MSAVSALYIWDSTLNSNLWILLDPDTYLQVKPTPAIVYFPYPIALFVFPHLHRSIPGGCRWMFTSIMP